MSLSARTEPGSYGRAVVGADGMGQMYRSTDTGLHHDVAIKIAAEQFSVHRNIHRMNAHY